MTTTIQTEHIQDNQHSSATGISGARLEPIDAGVLSAVIGGKGSSSVKQFGKDMQSKGEFVGVAGAVASAVPVLGETGIPEAVAATGGTTWLLGKGVEALGGLF